MPKQISLAPCRRSIHAALLLSGLLAFVVALNAQFARIASASDAVEPVTNKIPDRVNPFDSEMDMTGSSERRECTSLASVRWLPHSTVSIGYARGDFTGAERDAFHKAVSLWQRALAQTNVDIILKESGELDRGIEPAQSQIIIKRDYLMNSRYYGKILASTRRDNYVERATILINGSLHKRSSLRKTFLHELGHGLGLRDCPDCRSGSTVMNYFSEQLVMGFKIRKGNKVSDQPTACDISQVINGYRQSPLPMAGNVEDKSEEARTIVADEMVASPAAKSSNSDDNIIAPYLKPAPALEANRPQIAPYPKPAVLNKLNLFGIAQYPRGASTRVANMMAIASYEKPFTFKESDLFATAQHPRLSSTRAGSMLAPVPYLQPLPIQEFNLFTKLSYSTARAVRPLRINLFVNAEPVKEFNLFSIPQYPKVTFPRKTNALAIAPYFNPPKEANVLATAPDLRPAPMKEAGTLVEAEAARNDRVLTDAENAEFKAYIPTLLEKEADTMKELNNYTFKRDLRIQTIDKHGRVTGEYRRISDMVFDDSGARVERGLLVSETTLRRLKISPEYVEDFSGAQLKGFELSKRDHYRIEPFMADVIGGVRMQVYRMTPLNLNAERAAGARVFYGFVWVDEKTGSIFKIAGCALPDDKQRYPLFETQRALVDGAHMFPVHTVADDSLMFPSHTVHIRMLITYTNYKRFASRVTVTEVNESLR